MAALCIGSRLEWAVLGGIAAVLESRTWQFQNKQDMAVPTEQDMVVPAILGGIAAVLKSRGAFGLSRLNH